MSATRSTIANSIESAPARGQITRSLRDHHDREGSSRRADLNGDGTVGDENGDGAVTDSDRVLLPPTDLVQRAHRHGLLVHPYTFRNERFRLVSDYQDNPVNEYLTFYRLGVDGVFSDFADTAGGRPGAVHARAGSRLRAVPDQRRLSRLPRSLDRAETVTGTRKE